MLPERFWKHVARDPYTDCWVWIGATSHGYGVLKIAGVVRPAHRVLYEAMKGEVPTGLELDHLCRERACVNPEHLEPVTSSVNKLRSPLVGRAWARAGRAAQREPRDRTVCRNGHHLDVAGEYVSPNGVRYCRVCKRAARRRDKTRRKVVMSTQT